MTLNPNDLFRVTKINFLFITSIFVYCNFAYSQNNVEQYQNSKNNFENSATLKGVTKKSNISANYHRDVDTITTNRFGNNPDLKSTTFENADAYAAGLELSPKSVAGVPDSSIRVPVVLSNPVSREINAFGLKFHFPSSLLTFGRVVTEGTLTLNWEQTSGQEIADGVLLIGGFSTSVLSESGTLFEVEFIIKNEASGNGALLLTDFVDDLALATTTNATMSVIHPPFPPILSGPVDNMLVDKNNPLETLTFRWSHSSDPDTGDTVLYNFSLWNENSCQPDRQLFITKDSLSDTTCTIPRPLDCLYYWTVKAIDQFGLESENNELRTIDIQTKVENNGPDLIPAEFDLFQNYPNPFNAGTVIEYSIPVPSHVRIEIYDIIGNFVKKLENENKPPGSFCLIWDGFDENQIAVPSGMYLYRIEAGDFVQTKKMLLMK